MNEHSRAPRNERTCVGCRQTQDPDVLVRLAVLDHEPFLVPDAKGKLGGRGVWVGPYRACFEQAQRGGFQRALKRSIRLDLDALIGQVEAQEDKRLRGLINGARRGGHLVIGTDAAREALQEGKIEFLWLAEDAAGRSEELETRTRDAGSAVVRFGDKNTLGGLFGRSSLGVVGICDAGVATAVSRAIARLNGLREPADVAHKERRKAAMGCPIAAAVKGQRRAEDAG